MKRFIFVLGIGLLGGVVFIVLMVGGDYLMYLPLQREDARLRVIVNDVRPLINQCKSIRNSTPILVRGKALVWDLSNNQLKENNWEVQEYRKYQSLPHDDWKLKAGPKDKEMTIFLVEEHKLEKVFVYNDDRTAAYRARYDIYVIYYPEKKAAGMHTIFADPPASIVVFDERRGFSMPYGIKTIVGNSNYIYSWIDSLPKETTNSAQTVPN